MPQLQTTKTVLFFQSVMKLNWNSEQYARETRNAPFENLGRQLGL